MRGVGTYSASLSALRLGLAGGEGDSGEDPERIDDGADPSLFPWGNFACLIIWIRSARAGFLLCSARLKAISTDLSMRGKRMFMKRTEVTN